MLTEPVAVLINSDTISLYHELIGRVPQSSVFGDKYSPCITAPLENVTRASQVQEILYADDRKPNITFNATNKIFDSAKLEVFVKDIKAWTVENKLSPNNAIRWRHSATDVLVDLKAETIMLWRKKPQYVVACQSDLHNACLAVWNHSH